VRGPRRLPPERLAVFVDLETGLLEVPHDTLGELLAGIVRRVLLQHPAQQIAAPRDCEADRERERLAEAAVVCW
jgi:hypothetical protein